LAQSVKNKCDTSQVGDAIGLFLNFLFDTLESWPRALSESMATQGDNAVIDIHDDQLLTPAQAASLRPSGRRGRPTHPSTIYRWMKFGVRGVRLDSVRIGGSLYTSREAFQRFADQLTNPIPVPSSSSVPASKRRDRLSRMRAGSLLDRLGI
jgi:hypothetical protein